MEALRTSEDAFTDLPDVARKLTGSGDRPGHEGPEAT